MFSIFTHVMLLDKHSEPGLPVVDPQTTLTTLSPNSLSITGQTHEKLTTICFLR